jgi:AhpD family alkylhydroperoxidase
MKLDEKIKSLIAVGASITANCQPCLQYLEGKALESGASADEISEAIEVGKTVRTGATSRMDKFIDSSSESSSGKCDPSSAGKCCC